MKPKRLMLLLVCLGGLTACDRSVEELVEPVETEDPSPITMEEFYERGLLGELGVPIGKMMTVNATVYDGRETRMKAYTSRYLLKVTAVNGVTLDSEPLMEFHNSQWSGVPLAETHSQLREMLEGEASGKLTAEQIAELKKGYAGKSVTVLAYETGGFFGRPPNLPDNYPQIASRGFGFFNELVVVGQPDTKRDKED